MTKKGNKKLEDDRPGFDLSKHIDNVVPARGAPSKYDPEMCDIIIEEAARGGHIAGMMLAIGIKSKDTWYRWQEEYPEFKEAVEFATMVSQNFYEKVGLLGMTGKIPFFNSTTYALIMNNKFKHEYSRGGASSGDHTEITVNQINLTPSEVQEKIQQKLERFKSMGLDLLPGKDPVIVDVSTDDE